MKNINSVKGFTIKGTGVIKVGTFGDIEVNDRKLSDAIKEAFEIEEAAMYDCGYTTGEITLIYTPYIEDDLMVIREGSDF